MQGRGSCELTALEESVGNPRLLQRIIVSHIYMMLSQQRHVLLLAALVVTFMVYINDGISHSRRIINHVQLLGETSNPSPSDGNHIQETDEPVKHYDTPVKPSLGKVMPNPPSPHSDKLGHYSMAVESLVKEAKTYHSPSLHIEVTNGYTANAEPSVKEAIFHPLSAYNDEPDQYTEAVKPSAVAIDKHLPSLTGDMPALPIQTQAVQAKLVSSDDFEALLQLCNETEWTEGLWLHCHSYCGINQTAMCGGLNNARNRIQTCLRLAIDGGMGMILPSATTRDEANLVHTDGGMTVCAEKFWDTLHLQKALGERCPQLQIRSCDDRSGIDTVLEAPGRSYLEPSYTNGTFRPLINDVLEAAALNFTDVTPSNPVLITFGDSYVGWNYRHSFELSTIRKALFKTLKFNERLLNLGSKILQSSELQAGSFIGVHLRGESDWPAGFGGVNDQMNLYVEAIENIHNTSTAGVKVVYVSCGDPAAIGLFRDMLSLLGYTVHDKWTLLADQPDTLVQIEGLGFDEKAIVEYHTLVEATFWMGIITSSMSSLIAYARSVDEKGDFFETHIFPRSEKSGFDRHYPESPAMRGSNVTKLMVLSGPDIMDSFP